MGAIGVFDSGVGGLTIAAEIRRALPAWPIVYASDNAAFPYGTRDEADVVALALDRCQRLVAQYDLSILVIACNTASTVSLPVLRQHLSIPVVGVVPAIKPSAALSKNGNIGLLATPATVARPYTDALIDEFAAGKRVVKIGSGTLVQMAEAKLRGEAVDASRIHQILQPFYTADVDTVVLGCTHFPLLRDEFIAQSPYEICWVDSGDAIAKRCSTLVADMAPHTNQMSRAVFTRDDTQVTSLRPCLQGYGFSDVEILA